ncbi:MULTISPECIES: serine hydrolase domain-containing protein [unclassified Streptomyces]|uniref:serine hydrolase domain-containing protein n=1 Tax=unclassified Streptomyces TaxID=2593676 RepID=UPI00190472A9|nr:serine hydrolase domain-containing protein [Streptomyces sp. HSG2]
MADDAARGPSRRNLGALALGGALCLAPLTALPAAADPGPPRRTTLRYGSARRAGLLDTRLRELVAAAVSFLGPSPEHPWYAGAVLLAGRGGTVALHRPIGMAVRYRAYDEKTDSGIEFPPGERIPTARDTVFDLASLTKLFTSLLAVQQIERGRLRLTSPVAAYLPEFARGGKSDVTVLHLLTHTSGLRPWIPLYSAPTREKRIGMVLDEEPTDPPGAVYRYSDLNLVALQLVLERTTGRGLDVLLREGITGPLGMGTTRYNPPASWRPRIAATEDARGPWSGLERGLVWGEVHDENAFSLGGVAGHAGIFSCARDLAVLCRTLLNGGSYGRARILAPASVAQLFTDFTTEFPGHGHGLGFELYQHWYMGAMATPRTAGHTGFTGTSLVLDPTTDTFLVVLGNSVHPVRSWRSGSAPRVAAADRLARAVAVRPPGGGAAWFSGMAGPATLALPPLDTSGGGATLRCALWWDTEPDFDFVLVESSSDGGTSWRAVPFTTERPGSAPREHPDGTAGGYAGRVWHRLAARLPSASGLALRWRYVTDRRLHGRGVYVDAVRVDTSGRTLFDETRPADAARVTAAGWVRSID